MTKQMIVSEFVEAVIGFTILSQCLKIGCHAKLWRH